MRTAVRVKTMRKADAATIAGGVPASLLMQRAGEGIFRSFAWVPPVAVVCGDGNNGGDGFVLALCLAEAGIDCTVFRLSDRTTEASGIFLARLCGKNIPIRFLTDKTDFSPFGSIADCLLGTGFHGKVEGLLAAVIEKINASGKPVVSADINSGLDGENGLSDLCVRSTLTVAVGSLKPGHFLNRARDVIGEVASVDIGIQTPDEGIFIPDAADFSSVIRQREHFSHKGNYGYVALLGGCTEYAGAVKLANMSASALRAGCGVATLAVPETLVPSVSPYLLESTLFPLPSDRAGHARFDAETLDRLLKGKSALAVGMGWGQSPENEKILRYLLRSSRVPLVIDADGLNTLSAMGTEELDTRNCPVILTPHLKEFERLSGIAVAEAAKDPISHAKEYARAHRVILLLKGTCTVITDGETVFLVNRGSAGMATAGSGDVLSGILAGLLGYCPPDARTVACGAYLAGLAGEFAEAEKNAVSAVASDTVANIPRAVSVILDAR